MFHSLDLASADASCRLGGEAEPVGKPERRPQRGAAGDPAVLRLWHVAAGPQRPDPEVGIRSLLPILDRVVPHFEMYPLLSGKRNDCELFTDICRRMAQADHRSVSGLCEIVRLASAMNPSGKRGYAPAQIFQVLMS